MDSNDSWKLKSRNLLRGLAIHAGIAAIGGLMAFLVSVGIAALSRRAGNDGQSLIDFLPFVVVEVLVALFVAQFAAPRWFRGTAPFVGLFGLGALFLGLQELWGGWNPSWSHQTRTDYVLSQLFGTGTGCHDSECLYLLFYGLPFVCLTAYSLASLIALCFTREQQTSG